MTRSYTAAALGGVLLAACLATAEQPPKPAEGEKVMMLTKEGQPPRRCKVLRSWKHPSGGTAYEVKAEDTGEIMTVIERAAPADVAKGGKAPMKVTVTKTTDAAKVTATKLADSAKPGTSK